MGLGSFPTVGLAAAREKARQLRSIVSDGGDPIAMIRAKESAALAERQAQKTFSEVAERYIAQHEKSWKNSKHQAQWAATLRTYAEPSIGKLLVRDIRAAHVISVLEPIWTTKTETATRVRSRIELVLDYATARGLSGGPQPRALEEMIAGRDDCWMGLRPRSVVLALRPDDWTGVGVPPFPRAVRDLILK